MEPDTSQITIAGPFQIRAAVNRSQVTMKTMAERLGVSPSAFSLWVSGSRALSTRQLLEIAQVHAELAEERAQMLQAEADECREAASDLLARAVEAAKS